MKLSPSSAKRWTKCTAAPKLEAQLTAEGKITRTMSIHAEEGIEAALIAERILNGSFSLEKARGVLAGDDPGSTNWKPEWTAGLQFYVNAVAEFEEWVGFGSTWVEEKIPAFYGGSGLIPDVLCMSPTRVGVLDLKWGRNIPVEAEGNLQLIIGAYSSAVYHKVDYMDNTPVQMVIVQPRFRMGPQHLVWETTWGTVIEEARRVKEAVDLIHKDTDTEFYPSDETCQFCPIGDAGLCPARNGKPLALVAPSTGFSLAEVDDNQKAIILENWSEISGTVSSWKEDFLRRGQSGETLPAGMYIGTTKGGNRRWLPEAELALRKQALELLGDDTPIYEPRSLLSPAQVDKLRFGKTKLSTEGLTEKPPGGPKLSFEGSNDPAFEKKGLVAPQVDV